MKTLRITLAAMLVAVAFNAPLMAQDQQKTESKAKPAAAALKEHKCNKSCTAAGHNYLHGEKGHVCTDACKKPAANASKKA